MSCSPLQTPTRPVRRCNSLAPGHRWVQLPQVGRRAACKPGDWLVDDDGEIHTVDADVFAATYRQIRRGAYVKCTSVWAEVAQEAGSVATKEGRTSYNRGDVVVFNDEDGTDGYAMTVERFNSRYEPDQ